MMRAGGTSYYSLVDGTPVSLVLFLIQENGRKEIARISCVTSFARHLIRLLPYPNKYIPAEEESRIGEAHARVQ